MEDIPILTWQIERSWNAIIMSRLLRTHFCICMFDGGYTIITDTVDNGESQIEKWHGDNLYIEVYSIKNMEDKYDITITLTDPNNIVTEEKLESLKIYTKPLIGDATQ